MLKNFAYEICDCNGEWEMSKFIEQTVSYVSELVSDDHVILGLSGGVDSSVVAALLHKQLVLIFIVFMSITDSCDTMKPTK